MVLPYMQIELSTKRRGKESTFTTSKGGGEFLNNYIKEKTMSTLRQLEPAPGIPGASVSVEGKLLNSSNYSSVSASVRVTVPVRNNEADINEATVIAQDIVTSAAYDHVVELGNALMAAQNAQ